ncbi:ATP cone domain-containing protein [Campylobacter jejuni]|uniref:ATP cone domain-containing protein n=1 Tax=Campylobacter jejuni TaxID=197 RepID=UPI0021AD7D20|nr:ATP cone domain-containing protein [Campylobacter jejuni]
MKVIKRNGRTEELDVSKIKKCTSDAVKDLEGVNLSELELDAKIQLSRAEFKYLFIA